jgi:hypothetical protein
MSFSCKSAGTATNCATCKHNPMNQRTESLLRYLTVKVDRNGKCKHYEGRGHVR